MTSNPTAPTIIAVVVARAGMIFPAINLIQKLEDSFILQFLALILATADTNSICQFAGSSFSNSVGLSFPFCQTCIDKSSFASYSTHSSSSSTFSSVVSLSSTFTVIFFTTNFSTVAFCNSYLNTLTSFSYYNPKMLAKIFAVD